MSFEIASGAVVGVRGASGAGKSSLIRVLIGDLAPTGGVIAWDDETRPPPFAIAPQETLLLDDTISANIAFGRAVSADAISRVAVLVGLDQVLAQSGRTLNFKVGERGCELSGGERQRVALARALAAPRPLYVLDEATSALDAASEMEVLSNLAAERGNATIIIVSHRPAAFALCSGIIELNDGVIEFHDRASHATADTDSHTGSLDPRSSEART
ncbi:MAG: ABC transporter ATP-binding protein/permease [Hyphomonadaceae bacterium]|nr:ABC transporter ATP-binding protein/permease [Hyphomonadaceae bacterium]